MQWILQEFEDTKKLADTLDHLNIPYTWHKVIPFIGELTPEPNIVNSNAVIMFGSYTLWRYAQSNNLKPGVFKIKPFIHEKLWHPYLLNGVNAKLLTVRELPGKLSNDDKDWFIRPVNDSKEEPGRVRSANEIIELANKVLALDESEIPDGSLQHNTKLMLTEPVSILQEWRIWIIQNEVVTYSLYKEFGRVIYRYEIDEDALVFAKRMAETNTNYSAAYVMDICRTDKGLKIVETNCLNAAGFYSANLLDLVQAIHNLPLEPTKQL